MTFDFGVRGSHLDAAREISPKTSVPDGLQCGRALAQTSCSSTPPDRRHCHAQNSHHPGRAPQGQGHGWFRLAQIDRIRPDRLVLLKLDYPGTTAPPLEEALGWRPQSPSTLDRLFNASRTRTPGRQLTWHSVSRPAGACEDRLEGVCEGKLGLITGEAFGLLRRQAAANRGRIRNCARTAESRKPTTLIHDFPGARHRGE